MLIRIVASILLVLVPCVAVLNAQVFPQSKVQWNLTGTWKADVMGSHLEIHVNQQDNAISGVAFFYNSMGKKFTKNFSGSVNGSSIMGSASGASFYGNVISQNSAAGVLLTKDGSRIPIHASRK
jgi:hypothetical protein